MTRWLIVLLAAATLSSCGRRRDAGADQEPTPSASVFSVGVEMGGCDDVATCARECDAGSSDRCRRMGVSYEFGKGVEKDPERATLLYEKACALNDAEGCVAAGRMYEFHHGVSKDDAKAVSFYERACNHQNFVGCANLAIMLERGRGTAPDEARATELFDQACTRGSGLACEHAKALHTRTVPPRESQPSPVDR